MTPNIQIFNNPDFGEVRVTELKEFFKNIPFVADILSGTRERKYIFPKTYLMVDEGSGFYKIGKSTNLLKRCSQLKNTCPLLEFIASCNADIEKQLHDEFGIKHHRGEWYNLSKDDVDYILNLFKNINKESEENDE